MAAGTAALMRAIKNDPHGDTVLAQISPAEAARLKAEGGADAISPAVSRLLGMRVKQFYAGGATEAGNNAARSAVGNTYGGGSGGGKSGGASSSQLQSIAQNAPVIGRKEDLRAAGVQGLTGGTLGTNRPVSQGGAGTASLTSDNNVVDPRSRPVPDQTTDATGRPLTEGSTAIIAHPSIGQVESGVGLALGLLTGGAMAVPGLLANASAEDETGRTMLGRSIDAATGSIPGAISQGPQRVSSSLNSRASDRATDDTRPLDAGLASPASTAPDDGSGAAPEYSDVMLQDRRKPYDTLSAAQLVKALAS